MAHTQNLFATRIFIGFFIAAVGSITPDLKQFVVEGKWNRNSTWNVISACGSLVGATVIRYLGDDPDHPLLHTPSFVPGRHRQVIIPAQVITADSGNKTKTVVTSSTQAIATDVEQVDTELEAIRRQVQTPPP
jgi:hypothetical protein